ncbi:MAG: lysophospholipid acyltransferase family protein [Candidatus Marinimicrobia bacterium]|nr:lysophospholipid acyltransferase family protein [Candidatus Neomarinimicrobiota bacterium]
MKIIRIIYKLLAISLLIIFLIFYLTLAKLIISIFSKKYSNRFGFQNSKWISKCLKVILGIRLNVIGKKNIPKKNGFVVFGNHFGYVELISLCSLTPIAFVSKQEIRKWPVLGFIISLGGTVFVDRDSGGKSDVYINKLKEALKNQINIYFSPEGTNSDGTFLYRFKSALFVPANQLKYPILPYACVIKKVNNKKIDREHRLKVAWFDDEQNFGSHFINFLKLKNIDIEMKILKSVMPDYDDIKIEERRKFSSEMRYLISKELVKMEPEFDAEYIGERNKK